jgi:hypothetical protein
MYFSRLQSERHFCCWKLGKLSPFNFAYWRIVLDWSTHPLYGGYKRRKGSKDQRNQKRPKNESFQSDIRVVACAIVALPDQLPVLVALREPTPLCNQVAARPLSTSGLPGTRSQH